VRGISLRAVLIGLVAVGAVCLIVAWAELVITYVQIGILQFPPVTVGLFLFLALGNAAFLRLCRRIALNSTEIMTVYCMMLVGAMIASRGLMEKLVPALVAVNYYSTPENHWRETFYPQIKPWLVPFNPNGPEAQDISRHFYERLPEGAPLPWAAWATPLAAWSVLVILVFLGFFCLAAILRRQWMDHERLAFPLVQLPLEMVRTETAGPFLRNRLTWFGFAVPAAIFAVNGVSMIYPSFPSFTVQWNLNQYFPWQRPWWDMGMTTVMVSFAAIGFAYLLPVDLVFSLWFFFLLTRVQDVMASALGMQLKTMPLYPTHTIQGYQVMGAYFVLVFYLARMGWPHLRQVVRKAIWGDPAVDDRQEFLPYRVAFFGLILSFLGSVIWCHLAGMTLWIAALEMFVYLFIVVVVMARSVAECGLLMTETSFRPMDVVTLFHSKTILGPANLTVLSLVDAVFARDLRGLLLTGFMDGLRISDGVGLRRRSLLPAFAGAIVVALVAAGALHLWIPYHRGGVTLYSYVYQGNPIWGFQDNAPAAVGQSYYDWQAPAFFIVGVVVTIFLAVMRASFANWPLHPIGYAVSASWTMIVFWFPCFVAWLVKVLILRYGGMRLFVQARPFFLGMILGEFSSAVIWTIFSFITKNPAPWFPWP
jgi:hypothetical protein